MKHIAFDEALMGDGAPLEGARLPGFGAGNRVPETQRKHATRARSPRPTEAASKGLSRACVSVKAVDKRTFQVRVKGTLSILGFIRASKGVQGNAYSYKLIGEERSHNGFSSQRAALARMLEKC